ncbi:MAG: phosphoribosyl-AMP cyclohydrolase [Spirochaeta sp. LUC14_002_19_P3]|nr:MAG: phosphoribosyl-AMP cyclohydrolase [Spirochaeta sp. LUC14_002_19_P3]
MSSPNIPEPDFSKTDGIIPVIAQDYRTGEVLMLAWMNREAWNSTLETGKAVYWSRSRQRLWEKGETSGNRQIVREIFLDCDKDAVLLKVDQIGDAACHTGRRSCFHFRLGKGRLDTVSEPLFNPAAVYGEDSNQ